MNLTSDQKFICAMALGFIVVAAVYELVEAIYNVRVVVQLPPDMKPAKVIDNGDICSTH